MNVRENRVSAIECLMREKKKEIKNKGEWRVKWSGRKIELNTKKQIEKKNENIQNVFIDPVFSIAKQSGLKPIAELPK